MTIFYATRRFLPLLAATVAIGVHAQTVSGPSLGMVFESSTHSVRRVIGLPGAATLGPVVVDGLDAASIAPSGSRAVAVGGGEAIFIPDLSAPAGLSLGKVDAIDRFAWAPGGSNVALYSSASKTVQVVSYDGTNVSIRSLDTSILDNPPSAVAVSDDSQVLALVSGDTSTSPRLYLFPGTDAPSQIDSVGNPLSMTPVDARGRVILYQQTGSLIELNIATLDIRPVPITDEVSPPTALAREGDILLIATAGDAPSILVYDLVSGQQKANVPLDQTARTLGRMSASVFLISSPENGGTFTVLDLSRVPAVFFIGIQGVAD